MRLPVWLICDDKLLYVYKDGERKMDVYRMYGIKSYYVGTMRCTLPVHELDRLDSPWKEIMNRRYNKYVC